MLFFTDDHGISGAKESRPALNRLMEKVESEAVSQVVVFQFSRFARSTSHLLKALEKFREKKVRFISITEAVDTQSAMGVVLFTILGALAQLERELIRERVRAGLANAKAKGRLIGRVRKRNSALIESLLEAGLSYREIARIAKCSHGSVHQQKLEYKKRKADEEKQKFLELTKDIGKNSITETVDQMKAMNISEETVNKIQEKMESDARDNVRNIQGEAYDVMD